MSWIVCLIFFLSGAAALVFETLWFRQAGLALGSTVWASSIVLSSFMGGLALGNGLTARHGWRIQRPLRFYARLELVIASAGFTLTVALPALGSLLAPLFGWLEGSWLVGPLRLGVAFLCLLAPATAMGATLPVLIKALFARDPRFGEVLGRLYGFNTLGAVAGALAGELFLIERLGVWGTALAAAALATSAAGASALLASRVKQEEVLVARPPEPIVLTAYARRLLVAASLCGAALLALEVIWFRFLQLFLTGTAEVFAVMLAVVLAGIAGGGLIGSVWLHFTPKARGALATVAFAAGVAVVVGYAFFDPGGSGAYYTDAPSAARLAVGLLLGVCVLSGVLFTLQGAALHEELAEGSARETRAAGLLALANTVGGIVGSLLAGFVLLPALGVERSLFALAVLYGGVALCLWESPRRAGLRRALLVGSGLCLLLTLVGFPFGAMTRRHLPASAQKYMDDPANPMRTVALREGVNCTVRCLQKDLLGRPLHHRLMTNGYSMSGSQLGARRYMKLYVYLPVAIQPRLKSALLIGFGVGQTAKALTDTASLEEIHVADPTPEILAMSPIIFQGSAQDPLRDPRVRVHVEDGRFFLQTTRRRFDLITGEPPPPKVAGIVNLYTRDYFQLMHDRLTDDGLVTYWLPGASLSEADARAIARAFLDVFEDASLWQGWGLNLMLVGSRGGERSPPTEEQFTRQWRDAKLAPELSALGFEVPEQLGALFLADAPLLRERLKDVAPLVDAYPYRLSPEVLPPQQAWVELSPWLDVAPARARFAESPWVKSAWPPALRERTLDWFGVQEIAGMAPALSGGALRLEQLELCLSRPQLVTLPLWLLSSGQDEVRIAAAAAAEGGHGPVIDYHLGMFALAKRRFAEAASRLARVQEAYPNNTRVRLVRAYALCRAGDLSGARAVRAEARRSEGLSAEPDWAWLERRFDL